MTNDETGKKSIFSILKGGGFFPGIVVGFAIGLAIDNFFVGLGLTIAIALAWYTFKGKQKAETEES